MVALFCVEAPLIDFLDDQIIDLQCQMAQLQSSSSNHKKIEKCRAELKRLQMCRLKQSQNVPLIIKEIDTQTVYHFRKLFIQVKPDELP